MPSALASINDDRYEGNVYVIYGGNGSLVPAKFTLAEALADHKPTVMQFYIDDSSDCKKYSIVLSTVQAFYGRVTEIIPVNVDAIPVKDSYAPTEPGYYYKGAVPQVVVFNQEGKVVLDKTGQVPYEDIDDQLRIVFNLLPRTESVELKRRSFNEISTELTK
jgi:thiol-disulfide isomerase/thioredoxin